MFKPITFSSASFGTATAVISLMTASIATTPGYAQSIEPLTAAAAQGNVAEVRRLLDGGVPLESRQARTGWTPLITAARSGRTEVAIFLLERGANPNAAGVTGYTALMAATQTRSVSLIRTLLLRGANPDKATTQGLTALMFAAGNKGDAKTQDKDLECVKILLRGGADPDKKHTSGATAYTIAAARGASPITAYLRRVGAAGSGAAKSAAVVGDGTITGNVLYRERLAVSPAAFAVVRLLDVTPKVPVVLAQTVTPFAGKQVPVPFSLPYKAASLTSRANAQFALDAQIISAGAAQFRTEKPVPALTSGSKGKNITLVLKLATEDARVRLAPEAIAATDKAIARAGVDFIGKQTVGELTTNYTASFIGGQLVRIAATSSQGDYGDRTDRFYFSEGNDGDGFPILRASYLNARRIARSAPTESGGPTETIPGKYEKVAQKIILNDDGKPIFTTKLVDGQNQTVTAPDITAARNFARVISGQALRAISKKPGR